MERDGGILLLQNSGFKQPFYYDYDFVNEFQKELNYIVLTCTCSEFNSAPPIKLNIHIECLYVTLLEIVCLPM